MHRKCSGNGSRCRIHGRNSGGMHRQVQEILPRESSRSVSENEENDMNIANKTVLITGANRGIGLALVNEALKRGAKRVYAGTRGTLRNGDERLTPLTLDVTSAEQIRRS